MNLNSWIAKYVWSVKSDSISSAIYLYPTCLGVVQNHQHGVIGMTVDSGWYEPLRNNSVDREASNRAMEFELGWWVFSSRSLDSFSVLGYASCFRELQLHSYTSIYTLSYSKDLHSGVTAVGFWIPYSLGSIPIPCSWDWEHGCLDSQQKKRSGSKVLTIL